MFELELLNLEGKKLVVGEHSIYFEVEKNSEKVERTFVISHGACGTGRYMTMVAESILKEIPNSKVLILDLPYHGESTSTDNVEGKTVSDYAKTVKEFLELAKIDGEIEGTVHWIGWSMGGSIGLILDLEYGIIDELTMLNSSFVWNTVQPLVDVLQNIEPDYDFFKQVLGSSLVGDVTEEFKKDFLDKFETISAKVNVMVNDFRAIAPVNFDVTNKLKDIKAKTLIFSGFEDDLATVENQNILHENVDGSELKLIQDNHILLLKPTAVSEFINTLKNFV